MLHKVVRFRNFLRTWLPRRQSLGGADTSNKTGCFQTQILVNQKKEISWLRTHGTLPLRSHLLAFLGLFLFLFFHVPFLWRQTTFLGLLLFFFLTSPSCGDRPPSLVVFFSFSRPPFFWQQTSPGGFKGFHVRALVCSSSEKKTFAFLT